MVTKKFNVDFGHLVKDARLKMGLTQEEVAWKAGISQVYYCYLEKGKRNIDLELALKLCDILTIDIQDFAKRYIK